MKKEKNSKTLTKIFIGLICFISFAITLSLADIFSSLITVGGFSFANDEIIQNEYKIYAVYTSSHPTKILADEFSADIKKQGGAGYVYMNKQSYIIIASIYETIGDAEKVKENIIELKPNAGIETLIIPKITISSNLSSEEKNTIVGAISIFKTAYKKLYDLSVSLDTSVINEVNAKLAINEINSEITTIYGNFNTLFSNLSSNLLFIKLSLEDTLEHIRSLINASSLLPFSSLVKECYCKIIMTYKSLAESII